MEEIFIVIFGVSILYLTILLPEKMICKAIAKKESKKQNLKNDFESNEFDNIDLKNGFDFVTSENDVELFEREER
jgi:hypothetical protein